MKDYREFLFSNVQWDSSTGTIALRYGLEDDIQFTETLTLPTAGLLPEPREGLAAALQALHLAGGTSYYKTCCPPEIVVNSAELNVDQADFWDTVYTKGLGEFFYENQIDFRGLVNFPITESPLPTVDLTEPERSQAKVGTPKVLIPIGGGKDSIVTIERYRKREYDITLLRMGAHPLIDELVEITGLPCLTVKRQLSPELFALNEQGALNGHIPITAYLSCLCVVLAELYGFDEIALSNEQSASEGNVVYHGEEINHQWSKGAEFEERFAKYISDYINPNLTYRSELREMTELEVAQEYAQYPEYFLCTTSCNRNWKIAGEQLSERWCNSCPKCAFVYCLFAASLPLETLTEMFGGCPFENESLLPTYRQLLGLEGSKPFECVGTPGETRAAFALAHERGELEDTVVMEMFVKEYL